MDKEIKEKTENKEELKEIKIKENENTENKKENLKENNRTENEKTENEKVQDIVKKVKESGKITYISTG